MIRTIEQLVKFCEDNKMQEGGIADPVPLLGGPKEATRLLSSGELDQGLSRVVAADMSTQSFLLMELIKLAESIDQTMKEVALLLSRPPYAVSLTKEKWDPLATEVPPSQKAKRKG